MSYTREALIRLAFAGVCAIAVVVNKSSANKTTLPDGAATGMALSVPAAPSAIVSALPKRSVGLDVAP